jgi:hypothetical protein
MKNLLKYIIKLNCKLYNSSLLYGGNIMKKLFLLLIFIFVLNFTISFAQGLGMKLHNRIVYAGESPLSNGLGGSCTFISPDTTKSLIFEINNSFQQVIYSVKITNSFYVGPTLGLFDNATWFAPIFIFNPFKNISITSWDGIYLGEPGRPDWDINFAFTYHAIDISLNNFVLTYSILHFMKERPMNIPSIKYSLKVSSKDYLIFSASYHVRNDRPMFFMAWKF